MIFLKIDFFFLPAVQQPQNGCVLYTLLFGVIHYQIKCLNTFVLQTKKEITNVEDPFDSPTYNIPEKPVTFVEGASYSVIILAGLGVAAAAGYAVFKELIFQPKE